MDVRMDGFIHLGMRFRIAFCHLFVCCEQTSPLLKRCFPSMPQFFDDLITRRLCTEQAWL